MNTLDTENFYGEEVNLSSNSSNINPSLLPTLPEDILNIIFSLLLEKKEMSSYKNVHKYALVSKKWNSDIWSFLVKRTGFSETNHEDSVLAKKWRVFMNWTHLVDGKGSWISRQASLVLFSKKSILCGKQEAIMECYPAVLVEKNWRLIVKGTSHLGNIFTKKLGLPGIEHPLLLSVKKQILSTPIGLEWNRPIEKTEEFFEVLNCFLKEASKNQLYRIHFEAETNKSIYLDIYFQKGRVEANQVASILNSIEKASEEGYEKSCPRETLNKEVLSRINQKQQITEENPPILSLHVKIKQGSPLISTTPENFKQVAIISAKKEGCDWFEESESLYFFEFHEGGHFSDPHLDQKIKEALTKKLFDDELSDKLS